MENSGKIILIVDDNLLNLQVTAKILKEKGFLISLAQDGETALNMLEQQTPDLILLDIMMPGIDGLEVCRKIKQNKKLKEIPVIFLTAKDQIKDLVEGFKAGGVDYISKPFNRNELLIRVKNHLTISFLTNELRETYKSLKKNQLVLEKDLMAAAEIQKSLLPSKNIKFPFLDVAWEFQPCGSVGGDIFNVIQLKDNHYALYMVDVSGHGVEAALVAVTVAQALQKSSCIVAKPEDKKELSKSINSPSNVLSELNNQFPLERFDKFFTIIYAHLDCNTGILTYSHAGHPLGFVLKKDKDIYPLDKGGTIIGLDEPIPFKEEKIKLSNGDKIIFYTDGVIENINTDGEMYEQKRFEEKIQEFSKHSCTQFLNEIYKDVQLFGENMAQNDDISLLGIEFQVV